MDATAADVVEAVAGTRHMGDAAEDTIYERLWENWGFRAIDVDGQRLIPLSQKLRQGASGDGREGPRGGASKQYRDRLTKFAGGNENLLLQAAGVNGEYEVGGEDAKAGLDVTINAKGPIDRSVVEQATPIQFDPRIVDIQRSAAPILDRVTQQGQAGFTASYNVISDRDEPIGFLSEGAAIDLSNQKDSDHTLTNAQKDMKIFVDKVNISDFTVRAEASLGYMDVTQMTFGQRVIAHALAKAQTFFYGDPSVGANNTGSFDPEVGEAYEGMAKMASDAGNSVDKSSLNLQGEFPVLSDIKSELTKLVSETGLTYADAEITVSPSMFDYIENETNISTRIDAFDEDVSFGGRGLNIKGVPLTEDPNIRDYPNQSTTNFTPAERDVFIWDRRNLQFRSLMPLTTVPLARVGLANRAALAEFGTLISKSQGEHMLYLSDYAK